MAKQRGRTDLNCAHRSSVGAEAVLRAVLPRVGVPSKEFVRFGSDSGTAGRIVMAL